MNLHKAHIVADSLPGIGTSVSILFNSIPEEEDITKLKKVKGSLQDNH